jgi:hypothetical protein
MTLVGKILVFVIMLFAIIFLAESTVVFTTATDWKKATDAQKKKVSELTTKNGDLSSQVDVAQKELAKAKADQTAAIAAAEKRLQALEDEIKRSGAELTDLRTKIEVAQQSAKTSLDEAKQRLDETNLLRTQKAEVEKQANTLKVEQTDLNDKIREQARLIGSYDLTAKDLRDRVARYTTLLRRHGLNDDISNIKGLENPPTVEGEIQKVDAQNKRVEITIGSDDGLVAGHELYVFRTSPRPEYLGKIQIISTDPDQAVAKVIGNTLQGKKLKEGDHVSSTIRPR